MPSTAATSPKRLTTWARRTATAGTFLPTPVPASGPHGYAMRNLQPRHRAPGGPGVAENIGRQVGSVKATSPVAIRASSFESRAYRAVAAEGFATGSAGLG